MTHQTSLSILAAIDADTDKDIGSVRVNLTTGGGVDIVPTPVVVVPPHPAPPPTPSPLPIFKRIVQKDDQYAFQHISGDLAIENTVITQGGLVHSIGGNKLTLHRVWSEGAPGKLGVYFVLVGTGPGRELLWDNTGAPDRWICSGPDSGLRIMGGCKIATIINVDFVTRLHDASDGGTGNKLAPLPQLHPLKQPVGHWTEWKQNPQVRDARKVLFQGTLPNAKLPNGQGRVVGLMDIGMQAHPLTPQRVDDMTILNYGLQHIPHFTDPKSYGTVRMASCFKIDANGNVLKDAHGNPLMWPDHTWTGK